MYDGAKGTFLKYRSRGNQYSAFRLSAAHTRDKAQKVTAESGVLFAVLSKILT
jgi:hypothetical protein